MGACLDVSTMGKQSMQAPLDLSIFHKTKVCRFYQEGECKRGAKCRFAHGSKELQPVPDLCQCPKIEAGGRCEEPECSFAHHTSELHGLSGSETNPNSNDVVKPHRDHFYKTKLCKFHLKGSCLRGAKCRYAHDLSSQCPLPDLQCTRLCPMLTRTGSARTLHAALHPKHMNSRLYRACNQRCARQFKSSWLRN